MSADELAKILDELGQRLGPTGEHVFGLAIRQVFIDAAIGLTLSGLGLAATAALTVYLVRLTRRRYAAEVQAYADGKGRWSSIRSGPDLDSYVFPWVIGGMVTASSGAFLVWYFAVSLSAVLNPEYAALRSLLGAIGR